MKIGNREFDVKNKCYIMGILNLTPDSFYDGGKYTFADAALFRVERMVEQGVDILDIGGESTRPGATVVSEEEEMERVIPVLERIKSSFDVPVSLDTYKPNVAKAGIDVGVDMINDIWGLKLYPEMAEVIAKAGVPCCLMHNRKETAESHIYHDTMTEVIAELRESIELAKKAGISEDNIIVDPGLGFAKSYEENIAVMSELKRLHELEKPILFGASRKSFIGLALDVEPQERLEGTLATTAIAVENDCSFVRVHDVKENVRVVKMLETVKGYHRQWKALGMTEKEWNML